jgi:prepilin-type N-terminal cleavage/methylation domain-containing protein
MHTAAFARQRSTRPLRRRLQRRGFTLAELIVAIVLLTVGLGALASTAAWILREASSSRRTERAAVLARARLELLRFAECNPGSAVVPHGDLVERWSISVESQRAVAVVIVSARDSGRMREQRYQAAYQC